MDNRVLTDPVWGPRASPSRLVGPKRFQPVPIPLRALPPIDVVIVSHDHYDHLDFATIRELVKLDVPIVTSLGVGAHLEAWGVQPERIVELDWWQSYTLAEHRTNRLLRGPPSISPAVACTIATLRSGRHDRTLAAAFRIFSGDTGLTTEYAAIREATGSI